ncbi:hypothetical protein GCM10023345_15660 [Acinetobacter kookii]|uniref:Integral membrane protein n=1 Tax=Acinetobacter kookii TaxID=1226327 RepID=A0A1G6GLB0_9GAMM|nr:hypothetical protein [Acinetobacter kookii]SDB82798.1 hypothetical protein SAMN05421732_10177 [Acinetobacter kookii]
MEAENLTQAVAWAVLFSGIFLWVGMLTGIWKYYQIRQSAQARAHYYVDIAHRSSLLYAPASLIIAVLAYFSVWNELLNLILVLINLFFFSFSILSYILHGWLKDTTNQFKQPHQVGRWHLPKWMLSSAMILLIVGELGATAGLLLGTMRGLGKILI